MPRLQPQQTSTSLGVDVPSEDPPTTSDIFQISRLSDHTSERHSAIRHVVVWQPRDISCGEPLPPEEQAFRSRITAIEYMVEVAPMAFDAPTMTVEAWIYDPELYIATGRKRYGWWPVARFELVSVRTGDVLVEVPLEWPE